MYKNKVAIPPLTMQDDTLGISECGFRSRKMNNFLNNRASIMNLQFGQDKCEKMHIGKKFNHDICPQLEVDAWKDYVVKNEKGEDEMKDEYAGKEDIKNVTEKKYLGDLISADNSNKKNIKDKTNKGVGNVNKIISSLNERPYGKHTYKAAKLMREGMLLGSMLTNCESWINVTETDLKDIEKPDTMLQRKLLLTSGNPSKAFMYLELGITPVRYVIMGRRVNFYITY